MNVEGDTTHKITFKKDVQQIAPLDALFPTMRIVSDSVSQQTHNRKTDVYVTAYQQDVRRWRTKTRPTRRRLTCLGLSPTLALALLTHRTTV
jgi:hypothetical protein